MTAYQLRLEIPIFHALRPMLQILKAAFTEQRRINNFSTMSSQQRNTGSIIFPSVSSSPPNSAATRHRPTIYRGLPQRRILFRHLAIALQDGSRLLVWVVQATVGRHHAFHLVNECLLRQGSPQRRQSRNLRHLERARNWSA